MDFASTSSKLISETGSLADLDIRDVDLDSANVEEHSQIMKVSVHQGPVEVTSAIIDAGRALTMDNLVPAPQWAMLLTSVHAPPCFQHLACSRPSFPPGTREPISMLPGASIVFSGAPGAPPAPYSAMQSAGATQGAVLQPIVTCLGPSTACLDAI